MAGRPGSVVRAQRLDIDQPAHVGGCRRCRPIKEQLVLEALAATAAVDQEILELD